MQRDRVRIPLPENLFIFHLWFVSGRIRTSNSAAAAEGHSRHAQGDKENAVVVARRVKVQQTEYEGALGERSL